MAYPRPECTVSCFFLNVEQAMSCESARIIFPIPSTKKSQGGFESVRYFCDGDVYFKSIH